MPVIAADEAHEHFCPFRLQPDFGGGSTFARCLGAACMAWAWRDRPYDECTTDNLVETEDGIRPIGVPPSPGDGWEAYGAPMTKSYHRSKQDKLPAGTVQMWRKRREVREGHCQRAGHGDCGYGGF